MPTLLDRRRFLRLAGAMLAGLWSVPSLGVDPNKGLLTAPIDRRRVNSSSIGSVGYEARLQVLEVEFRSGALYRYWTVPPAVFDAFMKAESKGRYFTQQIRNHYEYRRLEQVRP